MREMCIKIPVSSFRLGFYSEDDCGMPNLSKLSNSLFIPIPWIPSLVPVDEHARLLLGEECVRLVQDRAQVPQKPEDEKRKMDRWRGGTQGSMRSDSRSIV